MFKINRKLEYALMALKYMAAKMPGELTSAKEISESCGSPFDATARVMQQMAHNGILRSEQGAYGGYQLIKDVQKVSFYQLSEMILGPTRLAKCLHDDVKCDLLTTCNIIQPVHVLQKRLVDFLDETTLGDLLRLKEAGELKS